MPLYEFACLDCGKRFEALVRTSTLPTCPDCEGHKLERLLSMFSVNSEGTRQSNLRDGRRRNLKDQRDKVMAEREAIHDHEH
jgi:putative FmdB family regulatory protein